METALRRKIKSLEMRIADFPHRVSRRLDAALNHFWEFECIDGEEVGELPSWVGEGLRPLIAAHEADKVKLTKLKQQLSRFGRKVA